MTARRVAVILVFGLLAGCGGGLSLSDYVDELNALEAQASADAERLQQTATGTDLTPQLLQAGFVRSGEIRQRVQERADQIEPPSEVAELHDRIFEWHREFMSVEADLAAVAGTTPDTDAGWTALSESDEMAAYRAALADGKDICDTFQAELDATAARGAFEDVPWLPGRMSEVVEAVIGCQWFPDDPANVLRWPPP